MREITLTTNKNKTLTQGIHTSDYQLDTLDFTTSQPVVGFFSTEKMTYFSSIGAITIEKECRKGEKIPTPPPVDDGIEEPDDVEMILVIVIGLSVVLVVVVISVALYMMCCKVRTS